MLVAVFRASDDGARTAAKLRAMGHAALLAPVLHIVPTGAPMPGGVFDGIVFTSAHGVAALAPDVTANLRPVPCFCVGDRTAELAAEVGFRDLRVGRADAERLARLVCAAVRPTGRVLLVAGLDRKPAIEQRLGEAGYDVVVIEAYEARAVEFWPKEACDVFRAGRVAAALHYSRRSADLVSQCAAASGVVDQVLAACHVCLSDDAAVPLRRAGAPRVVIAAEPNETSLLAALGSSTDIE